MGEMLALQIDVLAEFLNIRRIPLRIKGIEDVGGVPKGRASPSSKKE